MSLTESSLAGLPSASTEESTAPIPFVDLSIQTGAIADEVRLKIDEVVSRNEFVLGPEVSDFEGAFARYCHTRHCVGVGNGTDALELALRAVGVGAGDGDEVILPANTFVATAEAVLRAGAQPVLVDCESDTYLIDPARVAERIGPRTRAVVPVHLYGQVAAMEAIGDLVEGTGIAVVEDAAQAQGAQRHGTLAGGFGDVAGTSFYPGKNLGAWGDAGAVLTNRDDIASQVRALRNHGGVNRYEHRSIGTNSRLDTLQAVVLRAKLFYLDSWNASRRDAAHRYGELLGDVEQIVLPWAPPDGSHVWHLYVVQVPQRDRVLQCLQRAGIGVGIHYPSPIHLLPGWSHLGLANGQLAVAEMNAARILSLPMFPGITAAEQERVAQALRDAL